MLEPPRSLQLLLWRSCSQMPAPPQSLHLLTVMIALLAPLCGALTRCLCLPFSSSCLPTPAHANHRPAAPPCCRLPAPRGTRGNSLASSRGPAVPQTTLVGIQMGCRYITKICVGRVFLDRQAPTAKGTFPCPSDSKPTLVPFVLTCKDGGDTSICEHNRRRSICKDCWGASIFQHNRIRRLCRNCLAKACAPTAGSGATARSATVIRDAAGAGVRCCAAVFEEPFVTHAYGPAFIYDIPDDSRFLVASKHTFIREHTRIHSKTYVHACTRTYTHTCTHTLFLSYTHKYPRNSRAHTYIHEHQGYIRTHTQAHAAHTQTSIQAHTDIPTYAHAPKHIHAQTYTHKHESSTNKQHHLSHTNTHTHTHTTHTHTHMTKKSDSPIVRFWPLQDLETGEKCLNVFKVQSHRLSVLCSSVHKYEIDSKFSPSYFQVSV